MAAGKDPINGDDYVHESPFAKLLDMRVTDPEDGTSTVYMPINSNHLQLAGRVTRHAWRQRERESIIRLWTTSG